MWSQNVVSTCPFYLAVSDWLAGGVAGNGGQALLFLSSALAADQVEAWLEGLLLNLALAGLAGYLKITSLAVTSVAQSSPKQRHFK